MIMAERGFTLQDDAKLREVQVNIPGFTSRGDQLESFEIAKSRRVTNTRIHVERAIGRIKEYKITSDVHTTHILPHFNELFFIYCTFANFQDCLIS